MPRKQPKYFDLISVLADDTLYTAQAIMLLALNKGFIEDIDKNREHLKDALYNRKAKAKKSIFETGGDVIGPDGVTRPGYCGWRWRVAYNAFRDNEEARELFSRVKLSVPYRYSEAAEREQAFAAEQAREALAAQAQVLLKEPTEKRASLKIPIHPLFSALAWVRQSTRRTIAACVLGFALLACGAITQTDFYQVAREKGFRAALELMEENEPGKALSQNALFHRAYLLYGAGELHESERLANELLLSDDVWMQGKCFYLLGSIKDAAEAKSSAEDYYRMAIDSFGRYKPSQDLFRVQVALGLLTEDEILLDSAGQFLEGGTRDSTFWGDSFHYFRAKRKLAGRKDDVLNTYKYGELSVKAARKSGDLTALAWALNDLAMIYGYYHDGGKAIPLLRESTHLNFSLRDTVLYYKGKIAEGFIRKCENPDEFQLIVLEIKEYLGNGGKKFLGNELEELTNWSCADD